MSVDSSRTRQWIEKACSRIDCQRLRQLVADLTAIHTPTGREAAGSRFLSQYLATAGFEARYVPLTETSGSCYARHAGRGTGASLLLYAPIDTHLSCDPAEDIPWVGEALRADMLPKVDAMSDDYVVGLGASNPKSMLAVAAEAARCVLEAGVPLEGDLIVGTAGGGMPWLPAGHGATDFSSGVVHLLSHAIRPDLAIIVKPWDEIYHEHPGMAWFRVTVAGTLGYAGIPRGTPGFESSIVPAARVMLEVEEWLAEYPARHQSAQVRPEGWISAVRAGWTDKLAFPPAACEIYLDIRTNPDQTLVALEQEFGAAMRDILARHRDVRAEWQLIAGVPGARTDPSSWIVRCALRAWQDVHGREYPGAPAMSGQTDAAAICRLGVPVVRVGFPFLDHANTPAPFREGLGGMGVAYIPHLLPCCRMLIQMIVDTGTHSREEVVGRHAARRGDQS